MTNIAEQGTARRPEILIVEDNFLTATEVSDMVRDCGYGVAGTVARVKGGLEVLDLRPVDGAIVDINLGGTASFPLCAELDRRKVPYCFLTAYPTSFIPPDFRAARMLTKPCDRTQIGEALTNLLRRPAKAPAAQPAPPLAPPWAIERGNRLLQGLDEAGWAALEPYLERTSVTAGDVLHESGQRPAYITFPITGAVSLESTAGKQHMQVALVGREGMVGASLLLDGVAANRAVVQFGGATWRVPADQFAACLATSRELHRQLLRGVGAFIAQLSLTALANGQGTIEQRLARWLLSAVDRLDTDLLGITHDTLSHVLGVRRAGVTVALHVLEGKQALRSERRRVRILDRDRLSAVAGAFQPLKA
jgi:CRP-like cAMP-binding protein/CheY-like chemotaxis protein